MRLNSWRNNCGLWAALCALVAVGGHTALTLGQSQAALKGVRELQTVEARVGTDQDIFDFRSGFWMNLHHFLYQQALAQKARSEARAIRGAGEAVSVEALNDEQKRVWAAALESYQKNWANRDLLFDDDLVKINYRLAELGNQATLKQSGLPDELIVALERAAPVYRTHWWEEHDRVNRSWVEAVAPLIRKHGRILSERLAAAYREPWAKSPIRVEVAIYANWAGAYTTLDPTLITISGANPAQQGPAALEIIFHEASHAMIGAVTKGIESECAAQGKQAPRDLWHAVLFYTTGEIVKRASADANQAGYEPYAYKQGLYQRGWRQYQQLMERHWQPYLDGKSDFAQAMKRMVAGL